MQLPSANSDRLIFAPSTSLAPLLFVRACRSEPAKSTNDSFADCTANDVSSARLRLVT
jgi:hypothetical protein